MLGKTFYKYSLVAVIFFIIGVSTAVLYSQYDYYKWKLKFNIYQSLHVLEQIEQVNDYDSALLRIKQNVACEVENYQLRNQEVGFEVDQNLINKTMQKIKVECD